KEWIWGALLGLLLLAGAYLILNVINPQLVNLNLPTLNSVTVANSSLLSNTTGAVANTSYGCIAANNIVACSPGNQSNCSDVPNGACSGKSCMQVTASQCGTAASSTTAGGGSSCSYYTDQPSCQGGGCQWTPNAFNSGTCGAVTAQGTVQNGGTCASTAQCASGLTCVQSSHTCSDLAQNDPCDSTCNAGFTCSSTSHTCVAGGPPAGNNSACTQCPPPDAAACGFTASYCMGTCPAGKSCRITSQTTVCGALNPSQITVPVVQCQ
ncbi:MAG TPA: hypothetical protein VMA75_00720, partial [Candidatus Paceibacterota bacterium]|nr:hypothetical protein [Candidatus Paceibacterota bacterium]